jgi:hypothetical protein
MFETVRKVLEKPGQGTNITLCLDDGWLSEGSYDDCMNLSIKIRTDINLSGLVANEQKCIWKPC